MRPAVAALVRALVVVATIASAGRAAPARWQTLPLPPPMPAPASSGSVEVDGARIYYATYGAGDPVILLHGGMGNGDHWAHQVLALANKVQLIAIDSRGQGRSTRTKAAPSYAQMAGDVIAVMDHLKLAKAAIVGWSDGGAVALHLGIDHPARVAKLFVFGAGYEHATKPRKRTATFTRYHAKCRTDHARMAKTSFAATMRWLAPVWKQPVGFSKDQLSSIRAPTLIALGEHDELLAVAHVEEVARRIPNARTHIFDDTSHFALWQDPAAFSSVLADFVAPAHAK